MWIKNYSIKQDLLHDVIAGLTISVLHIPQGMAYGLLAGVSPIIGLYVSFFPVIIYSIMGTSHHISIGIFLTHHLFFFSFLTQFLFFSSAQKIGTFAVVSIMLRNIANKVGAENEIVNDTASGLQQITDIEVLNSACLLTGVIMTLMGFLHLGALSLILSDQLVSAFCCGSAIHVATSQVANLFDITMKDAESGPLNIIWVKF